MKRRAMQVVLIAGGLLVGLVAGELMLRQLLPSRYRVWPPHMRQSFDPDPGVLGGVRFPSKLTINALGMRGDPLDPSARYQLLAVGGSTTICVYLDDAKAWPYRLQERLNASLGAGAVWVGNVGRPGHTTTQHLLQAEKLLAQHPEIDAVLLLVGANDLLIPLAHTLAEKRAAPAPRRRVAHADAFSVYPGWDDDSPWYLRNPLGRLWRLRDWRPVPSGLPVMDEKATYVQTLRVRRSEASELRDVLPDLAPALARYRRNLHGLADVVAEAGRRVIFLTQPTLYRRGLRADEERLLWGGGPPFDRAKPRSPYYATSALAQGMARYNQVLLEVCRQRRVECVDAAAAIPKEPAFLYDDAHFTDRGAEAVAELLAGHLLARPPLAPGS